jgi:hypothetical protein
MKELGLWTLALIFFPSLIIIIFVKGITRNMGFIGKTIVWILAIVVILVIVGMALGIALFA